ncbi:hypothetical protein [Ferrovibrio sp.]|uniref:hypothetical protein n=1 Tax=Ferrovibrio sp. TaxID=1917215 RepID=UPI001B5AF9E8|nr:hypothetical protein [Ferrovibrio sp.]MBP7064912.1 hypothetical protein [Ferrovibrio sp.]
MPQPCRPLRLPQRLAGLVLGLGLLAGCGGGQLTEPYFIVVPNQVLDPTTTLPLFSVCYNATLHKPESVRKLVTQHCANATPIANGGDLKYCSLSAPVRVTYTCSALSRTASEARPRLPIDNLPGTSVAF